MKSFAFNRSNLRRHTTLVAAVIVALGTGRACVASHHEPAGEPAEESDADLSDAASRGVELGEFRVRSYYPVEAQKSTVHFVLYAAVKGERFAETKEFVERHRQKLRDQVITATRLAPLAVFEEPDLATFRRRILIRLQGAVPELVVDGVYVSDFNLTVKSL